MADAKKAPRARCRAPKIVRPDPCGRFLDPGQTLCPQHEGTDPKRRCEAEAGPATERVRCHAWPLLDSAFCAPHDPVAKAARQAEKESLTHQLAQLRTLVSPPVAVKAIELLLLRRKVSLADVQAALVDYRVKW